jgi:hypothetical protein
VVNDERPALATGEYRASNAAASQAATANDAQRGRTRACPVTETGPTHFRGSGRAYRYYVPTGALYL